MRNKSYALRIITDDLLDFLQTSIQEGRVCVHAKNLTQVYSLYTVYISGNVYQCHY